MKTNLTNSLKRKLNKSAFPWIACYFCSRKVTSTLHCVVCLKFFHPCCAVRVEGTRVVGYNKLLCRICVRNKEFVAPEKYTVKGPKTISPVIYDQSYAKLSSEDSAISDSFTESPTECFRPKDISESSLTSVQNQVVEKKPSYLKCQIDRQSQTEHEGDFVRVSFETLDALCPTVEVLPLEEDEPDEYKRMTRTTYKKIDLQRREQKMQQYMDIYFKKQTFAIRELIKNKYYKHCDIQDVRGNMRTKKSENDNSHCTNYSSNTLFRIGCELSVFVCSYCSKLFGTKGMLTNHISEYHKTPARKLTSGRGRRRKRGRPRKFSFLNNSVVNKEFDRPIGPIRKRGRPRLNRPVLNKNNVFQNTKHEPS